jgi:hypothetical protein
VKKRNFIVGLFVLALIVVATATGASSDQGRRLAGPFCVGKANLSPFFVKKVGWVSRAGVVRSVAVTEQCQSWELRKFGQPDNDAATEGGVPGPAGPAGKDGTNGEGGDNDDVQQGLAVCASNGGNLKLCGGDNGHDPVGYLILAGSSS